MRVREPLLNAIAGTAPVSACVCVCVLVCDVRAPAQRITLAVRAQRAFSFGYTVFRSDFSRSAAICRPLTCV